MIRQHFFPRNAPVRPSKTQRKTKRNLYGQNSPPFGEKTHLSHNYILLDPQITEPMKDQTINHPRRHYSVLRSMQSVSLQQPKQLKSKKKIEEQCFLIESRRKQICTPVKRQLSLVQHTRTRRFSQVENQQPFDLGLHHIFRTKQNKHRERMIPGSMRCKAASPLQLRPFELKVRGWETSSEDFVDFL